MILDIYFKRPVFWDYLISNLVVLILVLLFFNGSIILPAVHETYALTGDLTNIALTLVGFILTILTVLITFKDNSSSKLGSEDDLAFDKFFSTDYYYESVRYLKNCIKSIAVIATLGFLFKILLSQGLRIYLFYFNVFGLIVIMLTVYRCLLILGKILELQKRK